MLSAQVNEKDANVEPRAQEPKLKVPSSSFEPEGPKGSAARKWIVLLVIVGVVGAAVWKIRRNAKEQDSVQQIMAAQADRPTPVQVSAVQQKTMPIFLTALGTVTAYNTVTIKSRVDGQLMQVPVREGQAVQQGQMLAEIDPKPYQAALEQAQGQLVKDQANAVNARAEAERYQALLQAGVVSKESQQAQTSMAGQAEGSIAADQAAIQAAKVNLGYTKILSPINGVVGLRQVDPGNIVHASDTNGLLVVTQLQPISVIFTLPEDQLPEVLRRTRGGSRLADAFGEREPADGGQPDRHDNRHGEGEGGLRQSRWGVVSEPVCEYSANFAGETERDCDSGGGAADGDAGEFCLSAEGGAASGESGGEEEYGHAGAAAGGEPVELLR
jgi:multidrug efflux system membrane fusion protein